MVPVQLAFCDGALTPPYGCPETGTYRSTANAFKFGASNQVSVVIGIADASITPRDLIAHQEIERENTNGEDWLFSDEEISKMVVSTPQRRHPRSLVYAHTHLDPGACDSAINLIFRSGCIHGRACAGMD